MTDWLHTHLPDPATVQARLAHLGLLPKPKVKTPPTEPRREYRNRATRWSHACAILLAVFEKAETSFDYKAWCDRALTGKVLEDDNVLANMAWLDLYGVVQEYKAALALFPDSDHSVPRLHLGILVAEADALYACTTVADAREQLQSMLHASHPVPAAPPSESNPIQ